ncbi:MAG: hypothetical protein R2715_22110 [Ilumatobacteraceae bacterium]
MASGTYCTGALRTPEIETDNAQRSSAISTFRRDLERQVVAVGTFATC